MYPTIAKAALLAVMALLASCGSGTENDVPISMGEGAESSEQAVDLLVELLSEGDFAGAVPLAMPGQAALASLAEGATFGEVADALRSQDGGVAKNFWSGFAQGSDSFLTAAAATAYAEDVTRDGVEFQVVSVAAESGAVREVIVQDVDGFRVDLFASFAPGLADRMIGPVERLLGARSDDARLILSELRDVVPSLLVAAERPGQPPDVVQAVLRLVELITRVG